MSELEHLPHPSHMPSLSHHIFAFFPNSDEVRKAASALVNAGFHEKDIIVFEGDEGVAALDINNERADPLERFFRRFVKFSDAAEWRLLKEADAEIKKGHILMGLAVHKTKDKDKALAAIKRNQAYNIRYCSGLYIEDVV